MILFILFSHFSLALKVKFIEVILIFLKIMLKEIITTFLLKFPSLNPISKECFMTSQRIVFKLGGFHRHREV